MQPNLSRETNLPRRKKESRTTGLYDVFYQVLIPLDAVVTLILLLMNDIHATEIGAARYLPGLMVGTTWVLFCIWLWMAMRKQFHEGWTGAVIFACKVVATYGWLLFGTETKISMHWYQPVEFVIYNKHYYAFLLLLQLPFLWHVVRRQDLFDNTGDSFLRQYRSDEEVPTEYMKLFIGIGRFYWGIETIGMTLGLLGMVLPSLPLASYFADSLRGSLTTPLKWAWYLINLAFMLVLLWSLDKRLPISWYMVLFNSARIILFDLVALIQSPLQFDYTEALIDVIISLAIALYWYKRRCLFIPDGHTPPANGPDLTGGPLVRGGFED